MALEPFNYTNRIPTEGYLLIEAANLKRNQLERLPQMIPCAPVAFANDAVLVPRLLCLDGLAAEVREIAAELLDSATEPRCPPVVCAWLKTQASVEMLSSSIAKFLIGRGPLGDRVFWRYYDPRVFALMAFIFDEEQRRAILGPIETWAFPWRRQWWQLSAARVYLDALDDVEIGWPTFTQWDVLQWSAQVNQLHIHLDEVEPVVIEMNVEDAGNPIRHFSEASTYWNLSDVGQRCEFAYLSSKYGKAFRDHSKLVGKWHLMRNKQVSWQELLACLSDQDFRHLERHRTERGTI
jgi:hypothetical protein